MCESCGCATHKGDVHIHDHAHDHAHDHVGRVVSGRLDPVSVEVMTNILGENDRIAAHNRAHLAAHGVLAGTAGAALGGFLYEQLRGYLLVSSALSHFHLIIAGGLLLLIVLFAPGGLMGSVYRRLPVLRGVLE